MSDKENQDNLPENSVENQEELPEENAEREEPSAQEDTTPAPEEEKTEPAQQEQKPDLRNNAEEEFACKGDKNDKMIAVFDPVHVAMVDQSTFAEVLNTSPNVEYTSSEQGMRWLEAIQGAADHFEPGQIFSSTAQREGSLYRQYVKNGEERLGAGKPRQSSSEGPSVLSGERALQRLTSAMGLGTVVRIPLWHSGIWISIKAASDGDLLELERAIAFDKITLGRQTYGMVFSNSTVYIASRVMNFILDRVHSSSLHSDSRKALKRAIRVQDLPLIIWGMMCANHPNGFPFSQPCTADVENCQHVTEETLNLSKLCWTDNNALTSQQLTHMADRDKTYRQEDLERYTSDHTYGHPKVVSVTDRIKVRLKSPTLEEFETSGFKWVDGIVEMVRGAMGGDQSQEELNRAITNQAMASTLLQYAHWVDEVIIDDTDTIVDRKTIDSTLNWMSADKEAADTLFTQIAEYIDDSTISLIAIPHYDCPACSKEMSNNHHRYTNLIPLGAMQLFFTLLGQRIQAAIRT